MDTQLAPPVRQRAQVVDAIDQWRAHLTLTHRQFALTLLDRDHTEWARYRSGERWPTETFLRRVREVARTRIAAGLDGPEWLAAIDAAVQADALVKVA